MDYQAAYKKLQEEKDALLKDKDYLIQQQADEIERLRRDVKKQQEKMFKLAKKLPKRGEWLPTNEHRPMWECSRCGWYVDEGGRKDFTYCPNCGAKMEVQNGQ